MAKEFGNEAGVLEARWSTRNALTGHKDARDMRSQHLGNPNEKLNAFTPGQLRVKENLVGLSHGAAYKEAKQTEAVNQLLQGQKDAFQNVMRADARMQFEPQMWAAYDRMISKEAKQQVLKTIEAKMDKVEQVQASAMEKVQATAQIQVEATKLLAQAPVEVIAGGVGIALLWVISRLPISGVHKALGMAAILSIVLAACGTAAGTPNPEVPTQGGAVATETTGAPTQGATEGAVEQPTANNNEAVVSASLQQDPDYNNVYVQYVDRQDGQPLTKEGTDFLNAIGVNGKGIVDDKYVSIGVNSYGILYAEHVDHNVIVFNIKDSSGNYLIATKQEAFDRLSAENPSAVAGKTIDNFTLTTDVMNGVLASLVDETGKPVEGVNAKTRQWSAIDDNGVLVGGATAVPTETIGAQTSDAGLLETNQEAISAMVSDFTSGAIEFPANLAPEQYSAFIKEMNDKRGNQPIYVDLLDQSKNPIVWYYDSAKNKMVKLPGTYAENKDVIDQNSVDMYVGVQTELGTGNLQFIHPDTGELITVPNSSDMDWNSQIDKSNYSSAQIDWPTGTDPVFGDVKNWIDYNIGGQGNGAVNKSLAVMVPSVLIDNIPLNLTRGEGGGQGYGDGSWLEGAGLEMLFIRTDASGKPIYAVRSFIEGWTIGVGEEGGKLENTFIYTGKNGSNKPVNNLQGGAIYYVGLHPDQSFAWNELNHDDIDALGNITSEKEAYNAAVKDPTPDENTILTALFMIKKK